jgi:hypothetical protein
MFEAISNLVDNAIKFSPAGGCVGVRTYSYKGRIGVAVSDNGPGIPLHEREAVLRRFHRLEKSRHTPGSGLGLSLVAAVAKLHGLSLTIDSSYPGSCVTLERDQPSVIPVGSGAATSGGPPAGDTLAPAGGSLADRSVAGRSVTGGGAMASSSGAGERSGQVEQPEHAVPAGDSLVDRSVTRALRSERVESVPTALSSSKV